METLVDEQDVETQFQVHPRYIWLQMVKPVLLLLLLLFVLNFFYIYQGVQDITISQFSISILLLDILLPILVLVSAYTAIWLSYMNFVYIIKKNELVIRKGIMLKRHNSIPYNKIRNVQRTQCALERIFGLCTVRIETSSISLEFPDSNIPGMLNTKDLSELILKKTHANEETETNLGETMRQILSQLKDLNRRDQREEDRIPYGEHAPMR